MTKNKQAVHPRSVTQPLENDGWKITVLLRSPIFRGYSMLNFQGVFNGFFLSKKVVHPNWQYILPPRASTCPVKSGPFQKDMSSSSPSMFQGIFGYSFVSHEVTGYLGPMSPPPKKQRFPAVFSTNFHPRHINIWKPMDPMSITFQWGVIFLLGVALPWIPGFPGFPPGWLHFWGESRNPEKKNNPQDPWDWYLYV